MSRLVWTLLTLTAAALLGAPGLEAQNDEERAVIESLEARFLARARHKTDHLAGETHNSSEE